jgi:hypothetical protein
VADDKKPFLLRIERVQLDALQRWAADDLRSLNSQIEFLLRDALKRANRLPRPKGGAPTREHKE